MRFKLIFSIVGFMSVLCGFSMLIPALADTYYGFYDSASRFFVSAAFSTGFGLIIHFFSRTEYEPLRTKEMFLTTTLIWLMYVILSALPFYFSAYHLDITNSVFEAMSGLTTTGSTVLSDLDHKSAGILLWRSMLQWMGGAGIVIVAIIILPTLHIGGMQLFSTESSGSVKHDLPTVSQTLRAILIYLISLTLICTFSLKLAGMTTFDALNHAMTTISTGGFSTHDLSIGYYHSSSIEWVITFFMFVSSLPLLMGLYLIQRHWKQIRQDVQILFCVKFLFSSIILLTLIRWTQDHFSAHNLNNYIREASFAVVSVVSTTGFVSDNYQYWGNFSVAFFMFLFMIGGCTGSTSGGIKMFRLSILFQAASVRLKTLVEPHGVFIPRYGDRPISDSVLISILVFIGLYLISSITITLALSLCGLDFVTSFSGALSSLSNVGPALGYLIGPDKTFFYLSDSAKWILSIGMLVGRLEFISIFVLFFPFLWRKNA